MSGIPVREYEMKVLASLLAAAMISAPAFASAGADAGMAVAVVGPVLTKPGTGGKALPLPPFSKIRDGDRLTLEEGGSVQILFYDTGRRETWEGPSTIVVGEKEAKLLKGTVDPVVEDMGDNVGESMSSLSVILTQAEKERGGMTLIRGPQGARVELDDFERKEIADAKANYERLSVKEDNGIMAELYLASVLLTYDQRDEAKTILNTAVEKCAECEVPKLLLDWANRP